MAEPVREPVRLEVDVDEENKDAVQQMLDEMGVWHEEMQEEIVTQERFDSFEDLFEAEKRDEEGEWKDWPEMPGFSTHIAGSLNIAVKQSALEYEYRKKKNLAAGVELSLPVKIDLMARALVRGGGVKNWRGLRTREGKEIEFSEENFIRMYRSKRYRDWVSDWVNHYAGAKKRSQESLRGNS